MDGAGRARPQEGYVVAPVGDVAGAPLGGQYLGLAQLQRLYAGDKVGVEGVAQEICAQQPQGLALVAGADIIDGACADHRVDDRAQERARHAGIKIEAALAGGLDPSVLVDPGLKDPIAADKRRIECLLLLGGAKASPEDFVELVGDRAAFDALVPSEDLETDDPLELQQRVKQRLEAAARTREGEAKNIWGEIDALQRQNEGVDLELPSDAATLAKAHEDAVRALAAGEQACLDAGAVQERTDSARATLAENEPPDVAAFEKATQRNPRDVQMLADLGGKTFLALRRDPDAVRVLDRAWSRGADVQMGRAHV